MTERKRLVHAVIWSALCRIIHGLRKRKLRLKLLMALGSLAQEVLCLLTLDLN